MRLPVAKKNICCTIEKKLYDQVLEDGSLLISCCLTKRLPVLQCLEYTCGLVLLLYALTSARQEEELMDLKSPRDGFPK